MQTEPTAPVEPAAADPLLPAADTTELRVAEIASLDDAPPIETTEADPDAPPPAERVPTRHDEQMAAIVARRRERIEAERAEGKAQGFADQEPTADPAPAAPVQARAAPLGPEAPPAAPAAPAPAAADPGPAAAPGRTHKILVRGNEILMSDDDMRRAAELGVESEVRIRQADATLQEARRLAAASTPVPSAGPSPPAAPAPPTAPEPSADERDAMRELAREILYGDEEKVADALARHLHRPTAPPVDPDAIARQVQGRIDARLDLQTSLQTFGREYPEIINDPDLATLGANYVQQLRGHYAQTGTPRTELDLFREAGNAVRQAVQRWSGDAAPSADPAPAPSPAPSAGPSRVAIKRNMPQAPAAAAAQQSTPEPRQRTGADIVNWMRKTRGQSVYA